MKTLFKTREPLITIIVITCLAFFLFIINQNHISDNMDKPYLIIEDKVFDEGFLVMGEQVWLSFNIIKKELDPYIFWDVDEQKVFITTYDKTVRLKTDSLTAMVNTKPVNISFPVKTVDDTPYIPLNMLEDLYNIDVKILKDKQKVIIDKKLALRDIANIKRKNELLRVSPSFLSKAVTKLSSADILFCYEKQGNWQKVRTCNGILGYIPEKRLERGKMSYKVEKKQKSPILPDFTDRKLNMVWDYIHRVTPDKSGQVAPKGLDIISPTWFSVIDEKGTIESRADISYIEWAHKNNLAVWALIDNKFDPDLTHNFLKSSEARENIARQLLVYADVFKLDGINIDFENVHLKDKDLLVQFMREITPILREAGIVVSMDVTVKSTSPNWSMCYDRRELGKIVDFMILMAYDEHWASSPKSGSVASIGWVEQGILGLLEDIPKEKIILGLPFYTREWEEIQDADGNIKVSSKALSMEQAEKILEKNDAQIVWDDIIGQNFAYYTKGDSTFKIWLEDEKSIELKTSLIRKYDLAGTAAWRKGFESPIIWEVLYEKLKSPGEI